MQEADAVQVVLGEGEPGLLRIILEAEGFHVVGQARGDAELRRVLDATHPSVVVLDAGISAPAAMDARTRALGARVVVVWPVAVRTNLADERVDPSSVLRDLGSAVRRAAERAHPVLDTIVALPDSPVIGSPVDTGDRSLRVVPPLVEATPPRPRRRVGVLVAASLLLLLTASAAFGFVPRAMRALHVFERRGTPHAPTAPATPRIDPAPTVAAPTDDGARPRSCGRAGDRALGPRRGHGTPAHATACSRGNGGARGHANGNGNGGNGGGNAHGSDNGGGSGNGAGKGPAEEPGDRGKAIGRSQGNNGHP